eukprot:CAMPEP_0113610084 /NCGR_PEP_ID=MMETSP0017_2-20120614/4837_1 /TAXON_ID=2856 /ORGANISM="Cylindrotheca closterium" /LENGTH=769 /DNA_ID=CAMNT_0000518947 /DNA_START=51 /DNA_END=2360 /DNA_ORIENTATION=- /assembly_acc=CAM_ASM_000147
MTTSSQNRNVVTTIVSFAVVVGVVLGWKQFQRSNDEKEQPKSNAAAATESETPTTSAPIMEVNATTSVVEDESPKMERILAPNSITIAHGSVTGTCEKLANELYNALQKLNLENRTIQVGKLDEWDWWDELINDEDNDTETIAPTNGDVHPPVLLVLLPTHHGGSWPKTAVCLESALEDVQNDWRIEKFPLKKLHVAVLGMGCSDYGDNSMGRPAKEAFRRFRKLGAQLYGKKVRIGDDAIGNQDRVLQAWIHHDIIPELTDMGDDDNDLQENEPDVMDIEDMGDNMNSDSKETDAEPSVNELGVIEPREMVTSSQAKALKKEGYKLIGTHSAVKLCRWTKHQLRGRGGCYKHTFYGITSYQCMEATPSLACANKCVFCWRHHKNPVGKEWKWKTDDPHYIVDQAVKAHVKMIKETKGIPGVNAQRWEEAHTVRHCALSLVGEPIMYPRINEFLGDLHTRDISTFLVTNGQHPGAIRSLIPVTQLYVSVDAPTPESLIAVDRPLFSDAWERLKESLTFLKDKGQRTVARLTVVKGWNYDEVEGYAKLIALGKVSLIEVKGVTFCGKSDASNLNMSNTPWHHEVVDLVRNLKKELDVLRQKGGPDAPPEYDFACEHKHSVSVLLARVDQFAGEAEDGTRKWKTWIDYPKFQELVARRKKDPSFKFSVEDYTAETPAWALFGSEEEGFDPTDQRHRKKRKYPKYTKFDERGIPTHDHDKKELDPKERQRLVLLMEQKLKEVGAGTTVTELRGGEKLIQDASLMFRGEVIVR